MFSIFTLARKLDLDWHTAYDHTVDGDIPAPAYVGNLVRWHTGDIEAWIAAGCPVGPELDDAGYMRLQNALLDELREIDERKNAK